MVCMIIRAQSVPMFDFVNRPPTCELGLVDPPIEARRALMPSCIVQGHVCFTSFFEDVLVLGCEPLLGP